MKKLIISFISIFILINLTGCLKKDSLEDITIYTTVYPIEYITDYLYGNHSTIYSIYPDGVDPSTYTLNKKQIKDYSKGNMYVFNGLSSEQQTLISLFNYNKKLMIIDTTQSMEINYGVEELWLDPSNFLMLSLNIKNGLLEYITNHYLIEDIKNNYNELKVSISNIDAKLKLMSENAKNHIIVTDTNTLKFLEKYGFTVISLKEGDTLTQKVIADVNNYINDGTIKYIYTLNKSNLNGTVSNIMKSTNVQVAELYTLSNLTDKQRSQKEDYITLMNENIELLKKELYD